MRIGVYASMRNEESNLYDWLDTVRGADFVALNDTGSTDNTYYLAVNAQSSFLGSVTQIPVEPMELSNALNIAMAQLPDDLDLILRLDLDERLPSDWRAQLEKIDLTKYDCPVIVRAWFDHMGCTYKHTRVHSRHGFHWELPVHEILIPEGPSLNIDTDLTFEHHQDPNKDRSQVLGELEAAHAKDPSDLRMLHYLAREYTYRQMWDKAIPLLREHVASDAFAEERSESWRLLGDAYCALVPIDELTGRSYEQSLQACPTRREGWVAYSDFFHKRGTWDLCLHYALGAMKLTERSWYFNWPWAWGAKPYDLAALACFYLGHKGRAISYGEEAVRLEPDDERLRTNLAWYREDGK